MKRTIYALVAALCVFAASIQTSAVAQAHDDPTAGDMAVWFEIPVTDMDRAIAFYSAIFQVELTVTTHSDIPMAFFPGNANSVTGALIKMEEMQPGTTGPLIYLNGGDNLQVVLDRIVPAGGQVLVPKTLIAEEIGYFAIFLDTEGNRLGLFSRH